MRKRKKRLTISRKKWRQKIFCRICLRREGVNRQGRQEGVNRQTRPFPLLQEDMTKDMTNRKVSVVPDFLSLEDW